MGAPPNDTTALASPLPPLKLGGHLAAEDTINTPAAVTSADPTAYLNARVTNGHLVYAVM